MKLSSIIPAFLLALTPIFVAALVSCSNPSVSNNPDLTTSNPPDDVSIVTTATGTASEPDQVAPSNPIGGETIQETPDSIGVHSGTIRRIVNVSEALNNSGFDVFKIINTTEALNKNLMISPTSLYTALAMLINGADAKTLEEMRTVLKIGDMEMSKFNEQLKVIVEAQNRNSDGVELSNANSLWINKKFESKVLAPFQNTCKSFYNTEGKFFTNPEDYNLINAWCSEKTRGKIPSVLSDPIDINSQVLYLVNALYMKATWQNPFSANQGTIKFDTGSGLVDAKYMNGEERNCEHMHTDAYDAIKLRYNVPSAVSEKSKASMYVILPAKNAKIEDFINGFNLEIWNNIKTSLKMKTVNVTMPKFKLETDLGKLIEEYTQMGMPSAFDEAKANFKKIGDFSPYNLYVNLFKHKTFIEVNEKGTEAAAVTVIGGARVASMPRIDATFIADRPFLYAIEDEGTGAILFMGKVVDPTK